MMKKTLNTTQKRLFAWGTALAMCVNLLQVTAFAADENPVEEPSDAIGATTVVNITEQVWGDEPKPEPVTEEKTETIENEDGTETETVITTETMDSEDGNKHSEITNVTTTTTDAEGNPVSGTENVTGSVTSKEETEPVETTEQIPVGSEVGDITTTAPNKEGETTESSVTVNAAEALKPDVSGEEWTQNEDGSSTKTEDIENGSRVTTVSQGKDEKGNEVYTTKTVTTTTITEPVVLESPEEGTVENEDGTRTVTKVDVDENGKVIGYTQVTETLNSEGVVTSSVTKSVRNEEGQASITTTVENTKTQTVDPDAKAEVKVTMGAVTAGDRQGATHTKGLEIVDKPEEGNDLKDVSKEQQQLNILLQKFLKDGKAWEREDKSYGHILMFETDERGDVKILLEDYGLVSIEDLLSGNIKTDINIGDLKDDEFAFVPDEGLQSDVTIAYLTKRLTEYGWTPNWTKDNEQQMLVKQLVVTDSKGNKHTVYCADLSVLRDPNIKYNLENVEDVDYWSDGNFSEKNDPEAGKHINSIAMNGYWGTAAGETGSLSNLIDSLLAAKANGNPALKNVTEDEIRAITAGQAMSATQAAIWKYGNRTECIENYTPASALIGPSGNRESVLILEKLNEVDPETGEVQYKVMMDGAKIKIIPESWLNNANHTLVGGVSKNSVENRVVEAMFKYLVNLEEEEISTDLIRPSDIVEAVTTVKDSVGQDDAGRDLYEADVSFVLTVEPNRLNGDLMVNVYDADSGKLITTRRVAGDGANDDPSVKSAIASQGEKGMIYTIDGLQLANGQKVTINLTGSQNVKKGAYLITAKTGSETSQTMLTVEEGSREVDLNFTLQLDVTAAEAQTVESTVTRVESDVNAARNVTYSYYALDIPDPTPEDPTDPDPTDPTPVDPDPEDPTEIIPDDPTPLVDIPDAPVPLMEQPQDNLLDIFDEDVPLAGGLPTGNEDSVWYLLAALSLAGLGLAKLLEKKNTTK